MPEMADRTVSLAAGKGGTHVGSFTGAIAALVVGIGVAGSTVVGVVQSQQSAGEKPNKQVEQSVLDYGTNAQQ